MMTGWYPHVAGHRTLDHLLQRWEPNVLATAVDLLEHGLPEPFVMVVTLTAPHPPFAVEEPWFWMHDPVDMPLPASAGNGKPAFMAELRSRAGLDLIEPDDWSQVMAVYYGMVSRLDDQFGRLQSALEHAAVAERTITVFHTDHGEYLGDYGLVEKWPSGLDDCLVRNPLMVAGPGVAEGATASTFVEMLDLPATLCELAGVEIGHQHFGRSLVPVLADPATQHRDRAFSEGGFRIDEASLNEQPEHFPHLLKGQLQQDQPELVGRAIAMRTQDWTYVYRLYEDDELYNRAADPSETTNLSTASTHADVLRDLRDQVLAWLVETSDVIAPERDPRIEPALFDPFLGQTRSRLPDPSKAR